MIALFLAWIVLAFGVGIVMGRGIHLADEIEQPELPPVERHLPRSWVA